MDQVTVSTITSLVGSLGFPIVVAGWLLIKGSKDSKDTQATIQAQTVAVEKLTAAVELLTRTQQQK